MIVGLHQLKPGQTARVVALTSADPARLDRLAAYGVVPGSLVRLDQIHPSLILTVDETVITIDRAVAEHILVQQA